MHVWSLRGGCWLEGEQADAEAVWYDLLHEDEQALHDLARKYGLHPLAIEDCLSLVLHAPKVDDFGHYLFLVLQGLVDAGDGPEPNEFDVFLGNNFLISYQDERRPGAQAPEAVAQVLRQNIAIRPGLDGLFYEIADRMVDNILPHVHELAERLEDLQDDMLQGAESQRQSYLVLDVRARAGKVRRLLTSQLMVFQRLSRGEFPLVSEPNRIYFRDIYDHLVRIDLSLEGIREDAEVALSTYLSAFNNRISEVMKVLAVVGALALPASVIAGIFGTNFDNVPGLHSNWGFAGMIISMTALAGGMALYFRRRGWF